MKTADLKVGTAYAYEQRMDCRWPDRVTVIEAPVKFTTRVRGSWHSTREATGAKVAIEKQVFRPYEDGHTDSEDMHGVYVTETVVETVEARWLHCTWEEWQEIDARRRDAAKEKDARDKDVSVLTDRAKALGAKLGLYISAGWCRSSNQAQAEIHGAKDLEILIRVLEDAVAAKA